MRTLRSSGLQRPRPRAITRSSRQKVTSITLRDVLSNGLIEKSVHDLKRAVGLLDRFEITLEGVKDDTYLAAYLLDPNRSKYDLADLAREALGIENHNAPAANWPETA